MAQCKEKGRGNMSIFQDLSTLQLPVLSGWLASQPKGAILAKSLRDDQMASISNRKTLAQATSLHCAPFRPICSPFERLNDTVYEFTA